MRRKAGALTPLELAICEAALELRRRGSDEFHGYLVANFIKAREDGRRLASQGALYRALDRLEHVGYLTRRWEAPDEANAGRRPPRRLYTLTADGEQVCVAHRAHLDLRPQLRAVWRTS